MKRSLGWTMVMGILLIAIPPATYAQQNTPAVPGVTGTVALEGTTKEVYKGGNEIVVTTLDGVDHVFRFTKNLLVHGGKGSGVDALKGLQKGSTVLVHYTTQPEGASAEEIDRVGPGGLVETEGIVTKIDRGKKEITIRLDGGQTETLQLTDRAAADVGKSVDATSGTARLVVYYTDESGRKVAHYFKQAERH
jgi:archaellum component FlaG (FlaF/FlaG flagellin family)